MHMNADPEDRLIVALDFPAADPALAMVDRLGDCCRWVKVGLELFLAAGLPFLHLLRGRGLHIFLDLKLHDIPNTVAGAVRSVASFEADLLTIHAAGGRAMMEAAVVATRQHSGDMKLLAVTVLTSMDLQALREIGVEASPRDQVLRLAELALSTGVRGLVCSAEEVGLLRERLGPDVLLVVPGIRPADATLGDQHRVATAETAIRAGASMLVVGRPITQSADPAAAFASQLEEISRATRSPQS